MATDEELAAADAAFAELTEKDVLWAIYESQLEATRHLRVIALLAKIVLFLWALGLVIAVIGYLVGSD